MLVKFSVENYKSIYDRVELDFRIKPKNSADEENINTNPFVLKINNDYISKLCLFYGHNGSGKTNIFEAIFNLCISNVDNRFLDYIYKPNMIYGENEESKFEMEFYSNVLNENKNEYSLYNYKLNVKNKEIDDEYKERIQITKEILIENGNVVFERTNNNLDENYITKDKIIIIPSDRTFISFLLDIYTKEKDEFNIIVKYKKIISSIFSSAITKPNYLSMPDFTNVLFNEMYDVLEKFNILDFYMELIKIADIGIDYMKFESSEFDNMDRYIKFIEKHSKNIDSKKEEFKIADDFLNSIKDIDNRYKKLDYVKKFKKAFSYRNGKKAPFDEIESDGTKIYAFHIFNIVTSLKNGSLSLHDEFYGVQTDLIKTAFLLFRKNMYKEVEQTAQLFMTTHDIMLMDFKYLLLEQVKFVVKEKNKTYVYSASDIEGLTKENLIENYKNNKLGAKYFPRAYNLPIKMYSNNDMSDEL